MSLSYYSNYSPFSLDLPLKFNYFLKAAPFLGVGCVFLKKTE